MCKVPLQTRQNGLILGVAHFFSANCNSGNFFLIMDVFYFKGALRDNLDYSDFFVISQLYS